MPALSQFLRNPSFLTLAAKRNLYRLVLDGKVSEDDLETLKRLGLIRDLESWKHAFAQSDSA